MALLSRKYKPVPILLHWPSVNLVSPLPDMRVIKKHRERVQMTNDVVVPEAQSSPAIRDASRELAIGLHESFTGRGLKLTEDENERFLGGLGMTVCLGLAYSHIDDGLDIKHGYTEQCTLAAVRMGSSFLDDLPSSWQRPLFYSLQAGHFLGRNGRGSLAALLSGGYS